MKHFLAFILIIGGANSFGQIDLPANRSMAGPSERILLQRASNGDLVDPFIMHAMVNSHIDSNRISGFKDDVSAYIERITRRYDREEHLPQLLANVFYKVHQKYLKNYNSYVTFGDLITDGSYDCLTGTILYAWIMNELGYKNEVIVTSHHTYLMVHTPKEIIMLESTDALNGYIDDAGEIAERLAEIRVEEAAYVALGARNITVGFRDLIGLQYYNAAVNAYNQQDFVQSVDQLEKGAIFYRGELMKDFGTILARGIVTSGLERDIKTAYLMKLTHSLNGNVVMASIN